MAVEHQGVQHFEPVEMFGGVDGLIKTQERDERKARLCAENGVKLIYFRYDEDITKELVRTGIKRTLAKP